MNDRINMIRQRLAVLNPSELQIEDQSHLHAGHAGAKSGKGHFAITIIAEQFVGKSLLEKHRMVYSALGDAMETDIHAISIKALSPQKE